MIPVTTLISIAVKYVLPFVIVGTVLYGAYDWSYDRGYRQHQLEQAERDLKIKKATDKKIKEEVEKAKRNREAAEKHLIGVLQNEQERNEKLQRDIADISNKRMFVDIKRESMRASCDREDMSGSQNTGTLIAEAGAELSEEAERRFTSRGIEIEQRMNQLTTLIEILEANQGECLEIIGGTE